MVCRAVGPAGPSVAALALKLDWTWSIFAGECFHSAQAALSLSEPQVRESVKISVGTFDKRTND